MISFHSKSLIPNANTLNNCEWTEKSSQNTSWLVQPNKSLPAWEFFPHPEKIPSRIIFPVLYAFEIVAERYEWKAAALDRCPEKLWEVYLGPGACFQMTLLMVQKSGKLTGWAW